MGKRDKLSATEEHASRLISAQKIMAGLSATRQMGISGVPLKCKAGAPDPYAPGEKLTKDYRYYRVATPDSVEGKRTIELLRLYGYELATDGEFFATMQGGTIYRCHPTQYEEAGRAMRMIAHDETKKAAERERHRLQEAARYAFGSPDVTAEIQTREVDPRNL